MESKTVEMLENMNGRVCVVGSMNADYTITTQRLPCPGETVTGGPLRVLPGGKSANQAACSAKLGSDVCLLGAIGTDDTGQFLMDKLEDAGVDTSSIMKVEGASGTTVIMVDGQGENSIVYAPGANADLSVEYIQKVAPQIRQARVLGLCLESPMDAVIEAAKIAHEAGVCVLLNNSPFMPKLPQELIEACDILLLNEHEMAQFLDLEEPDDGNWKSFDWWAAAKGISNLGFTSSIVTLGAHGSIVLEGDSLHKVQARRVTCVDTTGCGDAFMGCILSGLAAGYSLNDCADAASYVGAYAACGAGAQSSYGTSQQIIARFDA